MLRMAPKTGVLSTNPGRAVQRWQIRPGGFEPASREPPPLSFHGDTLEAITDGERVWAGLRRCCENLGVDLARQIDKLRSKPWATVDEMSMVAEDGKVRLVTVVDLDTLPGWLFSIDPRKGKRSGLRSTHTEFIQVATGGASGTGTMGEVNPLQNKGGMPGRVVTPHFGESGARVPNPAVARRGGPKRESPLRRKPPRNTSRVRGGNSHL
jgi:hypothetical protein